MNQPQRDRSLGDGVYFASDDYIGFSPRLVILFVDILALAFIWWLLAFAWSNLIGEYDRMFAVSIIIATWCYLVPLKRSDFRTLGYRTVGAKLVTLRGKRPSLAMLTFRAMLWMFGPLGLGIDLVFCGIDDDRQTLRDRFTNMCLVKNGATPIGIGEVHLAYINAFGYSFALPRVTHRQ